MRARELEKILFDDGWILIRQVGSHRHYKHPKKQAKSPSLFIPEMLTKALQIPYGNRLA